MEIRAATLDDVLQLCKLAKEFVEESEWGWNYYEDACVQRFSATIKSERDDVFVADNCGELVGLSIVTWDRDFVEEAIGYFVKFYVGRKGRGTTAGRGLVAKSLEWFRDRGCTCVFVTSTAKLSVEADKQFCNLFAKFGFKESGKCLSYG